MNTEQYNPEGLWSPKGSYSQVVVAPIADARLVFVAGQVSVDEKGMVVGIGDIRAQTRQVLGNIRTALEAAGGSLANVTTMNVCITDGRYFREVNEARGEVLGSHLPASTMVEVAGLARPELLIEITAMAVISG